MSPSSAAPWGRGLRLSSAAGSADPHRTDVTPVTPSGHRVACAVLVPSQQTSRTQLDDHPTYRTITTGPPPHRRRGSTAPAARPSQTDTPNGKTAH